MHQYTSVVLLSTTRTVFTLSILFMVINLLYSECLIQIILSLLEEKQEYSEKTWLTQANVCDNSFGMRHCRKSLRSVQRFE